MILRPATESDHAAIGLILASAFGRQDEANLVEAVRLERAVLTEWVAEFDSGIAGHILFVRMAAKPLLLAAGLAPLSVAPERQGQGVGSALARRGLEHCRTLGVQICFVLGAPDYYGRFGFSSAPATVRSKYAGIAAFQALEFESGCLARPMDLRYPAAFG